MDRSDESVAGATIQAARVWAFDLDGCLVAALSATDLRPLARDILERLRSAGRTTVVWSAGGAEYARRVAEQVGIADLVDAFYDKVVGADGQWSLDVFPSCHRPDVFVDDEPARVPEAIWILAVPPYLGRQNHDRGLEQVLHAASTE